MNKLVHSLMLPDKNNVVFSITDGQPTDSEGIIMHDNPEDLCKYS